MTRPAISRAVVASKNADKIKEMETLLVDGQVVREVVSGLDWPDVIEDAPTLEGNALLKARAVARATGLAAIADDTGLEVDALDGSPGVHTARFAGPHATYRSNVAALLSALEGVEERTARFRTVVVAILEDGCEVLAEGVLDGEITTAPSGSGGFGYDPVFAVGERTLAEMDEEEKNRISHRARAIEALADTLRSR
ncbi:MAG: RdgB/HAM1 family non-canonical purine NTP pyrophosphatase [bacterium]|nr:RdgB/HAM1 family non-canonical purine NTP pyrophosphatase [bacterium]MDE0288743.1 RdgB/HAM1 family non-canonical purine NTP pyrophosphatase [bacterium]MDE0437264.1 RdgB/HAM1 family non-canonical purine NTP pyrophosphatase [bacterium]